MEAEEGDRGERRAPREDEHEKLVNELYTELYGELYERARRWKRTQPKSVTLETTGLVHDACLKFLDREDLVHLDRTHVLALAATAMRHVLVDRARARQRLKRTAPGERVPLDELAIAYEDRALDLVALDEALRRLAAFDPVMARAVDLRFFGGLSVADAARSLGFSKRAFERRWETTRAWLHAELR
jgi:RNA polymerase sigma factor (TIGR02999 family)